MKEREKERTREKGNGKRKEKERVSLIIKMQLADHVNKLFYFVFSDLRTKDHRIVYVHDLQAAF